MARTTEDKYRAAAQLVADGEMLKVACKKAKISAPSYYKWKAKEKSVVKVTRLAPKQKQVGSVTRFPVVFMTISELRGL